MLRHTNMKNIPLLFIGTSSHKNEMCSCIFSAHFTSYHIFLLLPLGDKEYFLFRCIHKIAKSDY